jgi:hypothetical protein
MLVLLCAVRLAWLEVRRYPAMSNNAFTRTCTVCTTPGGCRSRQKCGYYEGQKHGMTTEKALELFERALAKFWMLHQRPPTFIRLHPMFKAALFLQSKSYDWSVVEHYTQDPNSEVVTHSALKFRGVPVTLDPTVNRFILVLEVPYDPEA